MQPFAREEANSKVIGLVMALFFAFGFCTVLVDSVIPKLKATFALSYAEVMLTQFCFFGAYFLISLPAAWLHHRVGYLRGVAVGLLLMALGCLLFAPAAEAGVYPGFLGALFILASGVTIVQVAANPLATGAGDPARAASRLTLAQAFNSLATTVGPIFGAAFILSNGLAIPDATKLSAQALVIARRQQAQVFQLPFLIIAAVLVVMAIICWSVRHWVRQTAPSVGVHGKLALLRNPRLMFGAVSIFLYVGAEVSIGSSLTNYLMLRGTLAAAAQLAGSLVSVYWGLAMVGRFAGAGVMRRADPARVLMLCACCAFVLTTVSSFSSGVLAAATILGVGLFNSIMFPTIFALAVDGLGERTAQASGIICLAIVGGAIVPLMTGAAADQVGLRLALLVPAMCYVWIAGYARFAADVSVTAGNTARSSRVRQAA
ncbi:MAG: sugar MFS transporter [Alphaproteobacteria bacterium]|nr:sugar MFS transporter [Alphaproteobacteria bacterium]